MLERMLIPTIENRITVGIFAFLATLVLLGWAAINEGGRMQAFEQLQHARAIEQGAALFATNCTRCHGLDGRGLAGFGPGLNNPQFFGHDFFPEITRQINALNAEKVGLQAERSLVSTTDARKAEIDARLQIIEVQINDLRNERDPQLQAAIDAGYDPQRPDRLANLGWVGTRDAFIITTLVHGRPTSGNYWPNGAMPAWSQTAGGPLRMDQIEDLAAYIENWDKGDAWTLGDLFAVKQFAKEPVDGAPLLAMIEQLQASGGVLPEPVGTDVATVLANLASVTGDPARGDALYHNQQNSQLGQALACSGCHMAAQNGVGPMTEGTFTRASTVRLADPALAGYTAQQYLVESILLPGNYVVPGFNNAMLANFGQRMTLQDLADIIAYLETMNQ